MERLDLESAALLTASRKPVALTLSLGSSAHHRMLPGIFARAGILRRAMRFGETLEVLEADGPYLKLVHQSRSYRVANRLFHGGLRRLPSSFPSAPPLLLWMRVGDRMIARRLPDCNVFHGMSGAALASLRRASQLGAATILDSGSLHPASFQREVAADCEAVGLNPRNSARFLHPLYTSRLTSQYQACDRIIVYSAAAQRSFQPYDYASKTVLLSPGVDSDRYIPAARPRSDGLFRVCYVGRVEAAKGLAYLLAAWKQIAPANAELVLVGKLFPEMERLVRSTPPNVRLTGFLPPDGVARSLAESDLFVFPSANEGMSMALLQAMSAGLPVIACRNTGADDCVTPGENGMLVPVRNPEALADAILWGYRNRDALPLMGQAARKRVLQEFTLTHYAQRLYRLYESVVP